MPKIVGWCKWRQHLPLHELGLEVDSVEELLLALPLDVEALDLVRQVLDRGLGTGDLAESRRLNPRTTFEAGENLTFFRASKCSETPPIESMPSVFRLVEMHLSANFFCNLIQHEF